MTLTAQPVIGLVGGIGSGKSSVAADLAKHGGWLINADQFGHEALRLPEIRRRVLDYFALTITRQGMPVGNLMPDILDVHGEIDRRKLGALVFADVNKLRALETVVFPFIGKRIREEIENARRRDDVRFIVLDAAIMLEAGWNDVCDKVIFVEAPWSVRVERVQHKRGWTEADLRVREALQMPLDDKRRRADAVIDNTGTPEALAGQVRSLLRQWGLA